MGYTWRQFTAYRDAAAHRKAQDQQDALAIAIAGSSGKAAARLMAAFSGQVQR